MKPISRVYKREAQRFQGPGRDGGCGVQGQFKEREKTRPSYEFLKVLEEVVGP